MKRNLMLAASFAALLLTGLHSGSAQSTACETPTTPDALQGIPPEAFLTENSSALYHVAVFFHIINEDNGTGGPTPDEIKTEMERLEAYYAPHSICFSLVGWDEINDSDYASPAGGFTGTHANDLITDYPPISDVVDVYVLPSYTFYRGNAYAIPNHYLTIYAGRFNTPHLAHEMGHCLGLYHTHETAFGTELVSGTNCSTAGDLICDTPADPLINSTNVNGTTCVYFGTETDPSGASYSPDVTNNMSYSPFDCRSLFTTGQRSRMYANLSDAAGVLANVQVTNSVLNYIGTYTTGVHTFYALDELNFNSSLFGTFTLNSSAEGNAVAGDRIRISQGVNIAPSSGLFRARLNDACDGFYPSVFTVPVDSRAIDPDAPVSAALDVQTFPNPFTDQLRCTFDSPESLTLQIRLVDLAGQVVYADALDLEEGLHAHAFDTGGLPGGVYVLDIRYENGHYAQLIHKVE